MLLRSSKVNIQTETLPEFFISARTK